MGAASTCEVIGCSSGLARSYIELCPYLPKMMFSIRRRRVQLQRLGDVSDALGRKCCRRHDRPATSLHQAPLRISLATSLRCRCRVLDHLVASGDAIFKLAQSKRGKCVLEARVDLADLLAEGGRRNRHGQKQAKGACDFHGDESVKKRHRNGSNNSFGRGRRCPLWVKSGHETHHRRCPLYPRKRTSGDWAAMFAKCQ